jgi:methionyl-tRNA formyltransferase
LEGKYFNDWLIEKAADFYVVIAYGKILPQVILDIPIF